MQITQRQIDRIVRVHGDPNLVDFDECLRTALAGARSVQSVAFAVWNAGGDYQAYKESEFYPHRTYRKFLEGGPSAEERELFRLARSEPDPWWRGQYPEEFQVVLRRYGLDEAEDPRHACFNRRLYSAWSSGEGPTGDDAVDVTEECDGAGNYWQTMAEAWKFHLGDRRGIGPFARSFMEFVTKDIQPFTEFLDGFSSEGLEGLPWSETFLN